MAFCSLRGTIFFPSRDDSVSLEGRHNFLSGTIRLSLRGDDVFFLRGTIAGPGNCLNLFLGGTIVLGICGVERGASRAMTPPDGPAFVLRTGDDHTDGFVPALIFSSVLVLVSLSGDHRIAARHQGLQAGKLVPAFIALWSRQKTLEHVGAVERLDHGWPPSLVH